MDGDRVTKLRLQVHLRIVNTSLTSHAPWIGAGLKCRTKRCLPYLDFFP